MILTLLPLTTQCIFTRMYPYLIDVHWTVASHYNTFDSFVSYVKNQFKRNLIQSSMVTSTNPSIQPSSLCNGESVLHSVCVCPEWEPGTANTFCSISHYWIEIQSLWWWVVTVTGMAWLPQSHRLTVSGNALVQTITASFWSSFDKTANIISTWVRVVSSLGISPLLHVMNSHLRKSNGMLFQTQRQAWHFFNECHTKSECHPFMNSVSMKLMNLQCLWNHWHWILKDVVVFEWDIHKLKSSKLVSMYKHALIDSDIHVTQTKVSMRFNEKTTLVHCALQRADTWRELPLHS